MRRAFACPHQSPLLRLVASNAAADDRRRRPWRGLRRRSWSASGLAAHAPASRRRRWGTDNLYGRSWHLQSGAKKKGLRPASVVVEVATAGFGVRATPGCWRAPAECRRKTRSAAGFDRAGRAPRAAWRMVYVKLLCNLCPPWQAHRTSPAPQEVGTRACTACTSFHRTPAKKRERPGCGGWWTGGAGGD